MIRVFASAFVVGVLLGYLRLHHVWGGQGTPVNTVYLVVSGFGFASLVLLRRLLIEPIGRIASWAVFITLYVIFSMYMRAHDWSSIVLPSFGVQSSIYNGVFIFIVFLLLFIVTPIILSKLFGARGMFLGLIVLNVAAEWFRLQSEWRGSGITLNIELLTLAALAGFFWAALAWGVGSFFGPEKAKTRYQATRL